MVGCLHPHGWTAIRWPALMPVARMGSVLSRQAAFSFGAHK